MKISESEAKLFITNLLTNKLFQLRKSIIPASLLTKVDTDRDGNEFMDVANAIEACIFYMEKLEIPVPKVGEDFYD